jgi:cytochrome c oxidase subunit 2
VPGQTNQILVRVDQDQANADAYLGACNQYCGVQHAWMREYVFAQSAADFASWVQRQQQPAAAGGSPGEQLFMQNTCVNCHAIRGTAATAQVGPDLTHFGSRTSLGAGVLPNTPDNLARWIQNAQEVKPGALMPQFQSLSQGDIQALVDYLEGLQ